MFFKQYNYKPRSNSQSSTGSDSRERAAAAAAVAGSPPKETNTQPASQQNKGGSVTAGIAGRRRVCFLSFVLCLCPLYIIFLHYHLHAST